MTDGRRGNGKATWMRLDVERRARNGEHAHLAARDGLWCVTAQPVGFLWARLRSPSSSQEPMPIWDEDADLAWKSLRNRQAKR